MKRLLLATLIASAMCSAYATNSGGETGHTNCNGQGNPNSPCSGGGGNGGVSQSRAEARAMALAIANARAQANATGGSAQSTATGGAASASGGSAQATSAPSSAQANSAPSSASLDLQGAKFGGDIYYPRQTPPAYAPQGDKPPTSCRLFIGGGASSAGGAASGAIPIGNDAICLHEKRDVTMRQANKRRAGTFSEEDFLRNDCTIEGMSDTKACKELRNGS